MYGIFLPALLMVNVAKTIVSQPVASLLPIPVFAAMQIAVGLVVSGAAMRLLNIDPSTEMGRETKVSGGHVEWSSSVAFHGQTSSQAHLFGRHWLRCVERGSLWRRNSLVMDFLVVVDSKCRCAQRFRTAGFFR